jgi:hypothetical protein
MLRDVLSVAEKQDILMHDLLWQGATLREDILGVVNKHALVRMPCRLSRFSLLMTAVPFRTNGFKPCLMQMRPTTLMSGAITNVKRASRVQGRPSCAT